MSSVESSRSKRGSVDFIIPVLNEAHTLEKSVETVRRFFADNLPYDWRIVVANNGSTDGTDAVARKLEERYPEVELLQIHQRGRGRALRTAWLRSDADAVAYMDVDLSTDLKFVPELVDAILRHGYDVAVGSRLAYGSQTVRSVKREIISRLYNVFLKIVLACRFSDAQCGFKAVSRKVVEEIVPEIEDQSWFFDTEMLVLAERKGYRIKDIPVKWIEDDDSRVKIISTAWEDIKGVFRLRLRFWALKRAASVSQRVER